MTSMQKTFLGVALVVGLLVLTLAQDSSAPREDRTPASVDAPQAP